MIKLNATRIVTGLAVAGLVLWFVNNRAKAAGAGIGEGAKWAADKVNPASTGNFIYVGMSSVIDILDDGQRNDSNTLGTAIRGGVERIKGAFK